MDLVDRNKVIHAHGKMGAHLGKIELPDIRAIRVGERKVTNSIIK